MAGNPALRILVVEDDAALSEVMCEELAARGHEVAPARTVAEARERLREWEFEVALLDLMLPDGSGIDVLRSIHDEDLPTEAIVLTGFASLATAIEAMKLGAYDYLTKPTKMEEMELLVTRAAEKALLRKENLSLKVRLGQLEPIPGLVTDDPRMKELLATLDRVAASELPVLVQGESGTGKELFAKAIHQRSPRASQPFVAVNCAAVPETLLESELFGYERGAFTGAVNRKPGLFEVADRGVLLLDEIGEVATTIQAKLLRAIEAKEFYRVGGTRPVRADVRIVAATNKDLKAEMAAGRFREDLYYRLNGITLRLPPLRERPGDVPLLANHFMKLYGGGKRRLSARAIDVLRGHPWPGNVRELAMAIQRAAILCPKEVLGPEDLPLDLRGDSAWKSAANRSGLTLEQLEREYVETVLRNNDGHKGRTAKVLGIDPKTLYNKMKLWGLSES
jgi:DNA-binding NtrC family response regulator